MCSAHHYDFEGLGSCTSLVHQKFPFGRCNAAKSMLWHLHSLHSLHSAEHHLLIHIR